MYKFFIYIIVIGLGLASGIAYTKYDNKTKLDKHYFESLTVLKSRLLFNSIVDSRKSLEDYEDKIELHMHLDGYNSLEILDMKCQATIEAVRVNKSGATSSCL